MLNLEIEHLQMTMEDAVGHEHRIGPIAERAVTIFARRAGFMVSNDFSDSMAIESLSVPPVSLDWSATSDQQAAQQLADAMFEAVALRLRIEVCVLTACGD